MTLSAPVPDVVDLPVASLPTGLRIGGQLSPGGRRDLRSSHPSTEALLRIRL